MWVISPAISQLSTKLSFGLKNRFMLAIQNLRTGKFVYGTDYRYSPPRQRTSLTKMKTYSEMREAVADYNRRRCGKDYRIVVLKTIEVKRVIDFDGEEGYDWRHEIDYFRSQPE